MKRGVIWLALTILMVISLVLASCSKSTTISTSTKITTSTTTSTKPSTTTSTVASTTISTPITTSVTTTATGNWWDSLGTPQYGGTLTISLTKNIDLFDSGGMGGQQQVINLWEDALVGDDWKVDPKEFSYQFAFRPANYQVGNVATDWEFTGMTQITMHLNQNVYFFNVPPVNGRQFTAYDVVFFNNRNLGLGDGYTKPSTTNTAMYALKSVVAPDKFTVVFNWEGVSQETICENMFGPSGGCQEAKEVIQAYTSPSNPMITDWRKVVGAGAFMLSDFVADSSLTAVKNPNYWKHDERHPENQLPYINGVHILIIPTTATALAAVRTGKIDAIEGLTLAQSLQLKQSNPEIKQIAVPVGTSPTVDTRIDVKPFDDIRVRQAMQMAINLPLIASSYYQGSASPYPSTMTSMYLTGWTYPYSAWSDSLKATYDYNPTKAKQFLTAAGYPNGFKTSIVAGATGDLDLLQIVQSQLAEVGITMTTTTYDAASLNTLLRSFKQEALAFGGKLGFTFPPLMGFRHWQSITNLDWVRVNDPAWDGLYAQALAATSLAETQRLVVAGNKYEAEQQWEISLPTPSTFSVYQPWLKGYNSQSFAISSGTGVLCIGFYCSRFWIDQDIKKAQGH